jgi:hypothetical protein
VNLKTRLERLERRTGPARTRYVWLDAGETQEEALVRLERSPRHAESVVFIRWESETCAHGHA